MGGSKKEIEGGAGKCPTSKLGLEASLPRLADLKRMNSKTGIDGVFQGSPNYRERERAQANHDPPPLAASSPQKKPSKFNSQGITRLILFLLRSLLVTTSKALVTNVAMHLVPSSLNTRMQSQRIRERSGHLGLPRISECVLVL